MSSQVEKSLNETTALKAQLVTLTVVAASVPRVTGRQIKSRGTLLKLSSALYQQDFHKLLKTKTIVD